MTDTLFRTYEPHELGSDGYPFVWHRITLGGSSAHPVQAAGRMGVKDLVRAQAWYRCERCKHPYKRGTGEWGQSSQFVTPGMLQQTLEMAEAGEIDVVPMVTRPPLWSACDEQCTHGGPFRWRDPGTEWQIDERAEGSVQQVWMLEPGYEIQAAWRILTVHHLNGNKADLRWWNLAALCQRCHLVIQRKVQMERIYPLEHTDWFKIHAAGWYSYAYEGIERTRAEVMADLDRLLALERLV